MDSPILLSDALVAARLCSASASSSALRSYLPCFLSSPCTRLPSLTTPIYPRQSVHCRSARLGILSAVAGSDALMANSLPPRHGEYTVLDFMTRKKDLVVVKPTTTVDEALKALVENRISGFPVIDDEWNLVGVVSDYDLLALDTISGSRQSDTCMFPEADRSWKTFHEIQKLLSKTNGKVIGDVMTSAPLVVRETTNLEDVARLLLETKHHRFPVVDSEGKLIGIITRGSVVRAALQIKRASQMNE